MVGWTAYLVRIPSRRLPRPRDLPVSASLRFQVLARWKFWIRSSGQGDKKPIPQRPALKVRSHRLYHGWVHAPENGGILDEVLIGVMLAPHSYTGEDVVEINCHGGYQCVSAILEAVLHRGARLAEAGEFTRRAWLNGRIDLSRAEAVVEMIHARSTKAVQLASRRLHGGIGRKIRIDSPGDDRNSDRTRSRDRVQQRN